MQNEGYEPWTVADLCILKMNKELREGRMLCCLADPQTVALHTDSYICDQVVRKEAYNLVFAFNDVRIRMALKVNFSDNPVPGSEMPCIFLAQNIRQWEIWWIKGARNLGFFITVFNKDFYVAVLPNGRGIFN